MSHHIDCHNGSLLSIPVCQSDEQDDDRHHFIHISLLSAGPLKTAEGYSLDDDNATIYSDAVDVCHFPPRREWPDKILKKKAAQELEPQSDETIKSLVQVLHIHVDILASMRDDAWRKYRLSKAANVLARLTSGTTKCSICDTSCYDTQKLKITFKSKPLKKNSYECTVCSKYFGDSQSLKAQRKKLAKGGYTYKCKQYHRKYAPSHSSILEIFGKHEKICKKRLSSGLVPKRFHCTMCHRNYAHVHDLKRHID